MKFGLFTLGCKVNQYETQAMEQMLLARGHTLADFDSPCDCYIINTCTVTATGDKKSRNAIRRARKQNPDAVVGVCGCYAQLAADQVRALGADVVGGAGERVRFLDHMEQAAAERQPIVEVVPAMSRRAFEPLPAGGLSGRTRAMLKVQDGCHNFCTYCIIPYARGPVRSMALEPAVDQARQLAQAGYRELVVTGIELSSWGLDLKTGQTPADLIAAVCRAVPQVRIRLGSLEPRTVTASFCQALQGFSNLCPQFHLSLQSGCDTVLRRMNRKYDTARYRESVRLLRAAFPGCAITTDLIVGFPGETEQEFDATCSFLQDIGFAACHVFPYSRRAGTPAAGMPDQCSNQCKAERAARASTIAARSAAAFRQAMVGQRYLVLFEQPEGAYFVGHAPNYVQVAVQAPMHNNEVREVRITAVTEQGCLGELADQSSL